MRGVGDVDRLFVGNRVGLCQLLVLSMSLIWMIIDNDTTQSVGIPDLYER